MSEDTVNPVENAPEISPEIQDYVDNNSEAPVQPDKSEDATDSKNATETLDDKQPENPENLNPADQSYEVAGKTYKSFDEATKAIKRIAGDNTRLSGEISKLQKQLDERNQAYEEAKQANLEWQKLAEETENPDHEKKIEKAVEKVLDLKEQTKSQEELKEKYKQEIDLLPNEPDYDTVYPIMMELAQELGNDNIMKISPTKLYKMARGIVSDSKPITKTIKETEEKIVARQQASKVIGGNSNRSSATQADLSPEVADYINQF